MAESARSGSSLMCPCTEDSSSIDRPVTPDCECPRDEHDIVIHEETCLMYKNETIIFPHDVHTCECTSPRFENGVCQCCGCLPDQCLCKKAGREAFDDNKQTRSQIWVVLKNRYGDEPESLECCVSTVQHSNSKPTWWRNRWPIWLVQQGDVDKINGDDELVAFSARWRSKRPIGAMPAVLESTHPLMQKFQQTLKQFLEKENLIAEEQILNLREELRLKKAKYDSELETIYRDDHDTNAQRVLIGEYEDTLSKRTSERLAAEERARKANEKYKQAKKKLEQDINTEREARQELEALTTLCRQLETWREETESDLTVSLRMSDKMKVEKRTLADEKRQLDMVIYAVNNEVWKLESKLEMFQKQLEIKNAEMEKVNDKVTAYAAELEDLELDKRRLVSLWNAVLINIHQRDHVYNSVREDYKMLQENYFTLLNNLEVTKKMLMEEMNKGKEIAMNRDKLTYDVTAATKLYDAEEAKRATLDNRIIELTESIEMSERDQEMIKSENQTMQNILKSTEKDLEHKNDQRKKMENEILANLQDILLNDKAVGSMANGIKKMRELSRKQELALITIENQHAKVMLDIEVFRNRQAQNNIFLQESLSKVREREKEIDQLQEKYDQKALVGIRKQREWDIVMKKFAAMKEIFDSKSPQERRIEELEQQIKSLRERTEGMQHEWLRIQGHVVKLTAQHHKLVEEMNLTNKQIQICDQKTMRIQAECETVSRERAKVDRSLRDLRGRLQFLERQRKEGNEYNDSAERSQMATTIEYAANLKDAEADIIQLEEDIETMDQEKINLTQELDRAHREALIWERKGILAVELKRNIHAAKSAVGEIGKMKSEIHRMEVRREHLRRTSEKLAEDLALYVTKRDTVVEKSRAAAAVEKAHGSQSVSQFNYHHKLRLAKSDVSRVAKELLESKAKMEELQKEQERLEKEVADTTALNSQLEEHVATLLRECRNAEKQKQWLLERVVRSQRLGQELSIAVKRQSIRVKKPTAVVLSEYSQAQALNERIRFIVGTLAREFPHLEDKLEAISNTLNIHSPRGTPRLADEGCCRQEGDDMSEDIPEKPYCE